MKHYARIIPYVLQAIVFLPLKLLVTSNAALFVLIVPGLNNMLGAQKRAEQDTTNVNRRRVEPGGTAVAKIKPTRTANNSFVPFSNQVKIR